MHFVITITQLVLSLCFLAVAGIAKSGMDESAEGRFTGKRSSRNKAASFLKKWELDENGNRIPQQSRLWYYCFFLTPQYKERFRFSSTLLVPFTDYWHRQQFYTFNSIYLAFVICFYPNWLAMVAAFASCKMVSLSFTLYRRYILKNKT